jgi:prevent-host-death family protein
MVEVSVKEARDNFRTYLDRAEAGEEIIVTRRGKEVARIVPPRREPKKFPDLTEFRKSIELRGEPMSETVIRQRRESRY